ncbi:hypothetical protein Ddc_11621 [Ditylenchus destructor]|nr:hypothetical protein Ddc_11621 [Ditylenchus destructor]
MLPAYVLVDILKYMSRDALEKIQVTTRTLNILIRSDFSLKPFRVIGKSSLRINIEGGQLLLTIHRRKNCADECLAPSVRAGWQKCNMWHECKHKYALDQMSRFLAQCVRFQQTKIMIDSHDPYSSKAISEVESIAHIWSEQHLAITDFSSTEEHSLCPLLSNPNMLRCRILDVYGDRTNFVQNSRKYPALYALHAISFTWRILADEIDIISRNKATFPQSDCIFLFPDTLQDEMINALEVIREEFAESSNSCRLRMIFQLDTLDDQNVDFRMENKQTNEILELKHITKAEAKDKFHIDLENYVALLLERFIA